MLKLFIAFGLIVASSSFAADGALSRLRASAERDRQHLADLSAQTQWTVNDLRFILTLTHASGTLHVEVPSDSLVAPARQLLAKIAVDNPALFSVLLEIVSIHSYPYQVADLILTLTAVNGTPTILAALQEHRLISRQAIELALTREMPYYGARFSIDLVDRNLAAQLPEKLKIAFALFDLGVRDASIDDMLIEAVQLGSLPAEVKDGAIVRLRVSGTKSERAVAALSAIVMLPADGETEILRVHAVHAIAAIPVPASDDALWAISGLPFSSINARVISLTKVVREKLISEGQFKPRSIPQRLGRLLSCMIRLS